MTVTQATILSDLPWAVVEAIDAVLPELKHCQPIAGRFDLAELKKSVATSPAVHVSMLRGKEGQRAGGGFVGFDVPMAAYIVTSNRLGNKRDEQAANIAQALLTLVPENRWGSDAYGPAHAVAFEPLVTTATRSQGVSLWAVTWTQPVTFFLFEPPAPVPVELYVAMDPPEGATADDFTDISEGGGP